MYSHNCSFPKIEHFTLQLTHQPIAITVSRNFKIDNTFLFSVSQIEIDSSELDFRVRRLLFNAVITPKVHLCLLIKISNKVTTEKSNRRYSVQRQPIYLYCFNYRNDVTQCVWQVFTKKRCTFQTNLSDRKH